MRAPIGNTSGNIGAKIKRLIAPWSNTLPARVLVKAIFRAFRSTKSCRQVDYFYDDDEKVWVGRAGDIFIALGFHLSFILPNGMTSVLEDRLRGARDCWLFGYVPKTGDVVLDIGAGDGTDTLIFSELVGDRGRVFAIEAHPKTLRLLRATCKYNKLTNVEIIPMAIMAEAGMVAITDSEISAENRTEASTNAHADNLVPAITLDELFDSLHIDCVALLKMNIEGAELGALGGMAQAIGKVEHAAIACHDFLHSPGTATIKQAVGAFMREHGFLVRSRADDPRLHVRDHLHFTRSGPRIERPKANLDAGIELPGGV